MRAMILAAGRGERMGELTAAVPKPLLRVAGHYLIEYVIANLKRADIRDIVINVSYHAEQIQAALGSGERYGVKIDYSVEKERLEVGGGIIHALPLLGKRPFIVVSGDVITDYTLANMPSEPAGLAHLVMVDNPPFHSAGDFGLNKDVVDLAATPRFNFGNMGVYCSEIFRACPAGHMKWREVMIPVIRSGQVTGEHYQGAWYNIGTAQDLEKINQRAREDASFGNLAALYIK